MDKEALLKLLNEQKSKFVYQRDLMLYGSHNYNHDRYIAVDAAITTLNKVKAYLEARGTEGDHDES